MQSREDTRAVFFEAWNKHKAKQTLTPMEEQLIQLIEIHPEYKEIFENPDKFLEEDFKVEDHEENPFLHLGFHYTLLEQISLDQPPGIRSLYEQLVKKVGDVHKAEHQIMSILVHMIWEMLQSKQPFDHEDYLKEISKLVH